MNATEGICGGCHWVKLLDDDGLIPPHNTPGSADYGRRRCSGSDAAPLDEAPEQVTA